MRIISSSPLVGLYEDFLSAEECDLFLEKDFNFNRSLSYNFDESKSIESSYRTSSTCMIYNDDFVRDRACSIFSRFLEETITVENIESPQIQRYNPGEFYKPHNDFFNYPNNQKIDNDRIASILIYLNDNFEQGETEFPLLEKIVTPVKGSALFFKYNYDFDTNYLTFHSGLPVSKGTKYVITLWVRSKTWP